MVKSVAVRAAELRRFEDLYAKHRQEVCASNPDFARFAGPDFDRKVRKFHERAFGSNGILNTDVEQIMGCPLAVFIAYLKHFPCGEGHGLVYTGAGEFHVIPFVPQKLKVRAQ
ncbi:MAG: hypothetical protein IT541_16110 [Hyphomicrobiales bacterium]|nr:hypothetical protein [Hyphomicrobiales bacterium]